MLQNGYKYPQNSFLSFLIVLNVLFCHNLYNFLVDFDCNVESRSNILRLVRYILSDISCCVRQIFRIVWDKNNEAFYCFLFTSQIRLFTPVNKKLNFNIFKDCFKIGDLIRVNKHLFNEYATISLIRILLNRAGIESNPGPDINSIKFITINCNGLTNNIRLLQAIGRIKKAIKQKTAIIFIQESHNANLLLLENIWQGNVNISNGSGGSRGVITLTTSDIKVVNFLTDSEGRYLFTTVEAGDGNIIYTANIYSPNNHSTAKTFYENLFHKWDGFCEEQAQLTPIINNRYSVIAGDFNCVIHGTDAQNRNRTGIEKELARAITTFTEDRDLFDSVLRSPNGNNYTWTRGNIFSKIDYIFVSSNLLGGLKKYDTIWDFVKSDHAAISVDIELAFVPKNGRSYPKLSSTDISNSSDYNELKNEINQAIETLPLHWDPHQKLDFMKVVIRTKVLEIRSRNKISESQIQKLRKELEEFNQLAILEEHQIQAFNDLRLALYKEEEREAERLRIKAGIKWREEGERSTKYFLNVIKTKNAITTIDSLKTEGGTISGSTEIVKYARSFYEELYTARESIHDPNFFNYCPRLSTEAHNDLNNEITIGDLVSALKTCKDSAPGLDGIPYSYYKVYSKELLPLVLESWRYSKFIGALPQSQAVSCITLIPKAGKDKHNIKNWRPISLSSCDLKIITKALSIKTGKHLANIIAGSQMGYVPGRNINFNNRLMKVALNHCNEKNLDFILTSLDAQKAYDSVSHSYISKALEAYGFPSSFVESVNILHNSLKAVVQVNGHLSSPFDIKRGVKQGDALSCALFIVAIDPLKRNIEQNERIPHLHFTGDCKMKTVAYADDIAVVTANTDEATQEIFREYDRLTTCSGLTLNADKTEIINLSKTGKTLSTVFYNQLTLDINHCESTTICGNYLSLDDSKNYEKNITEKITKLERMLDKWRNRNLSINGKMIIVKTFAISQLIFSSQFQTIRPKDVRRIEHICYTFVWNGKDHVRRAVLKSERHNGGINGIDIESFFKSIAIRQYLKSNSEPRLESINKDPYIKEDIKVLARESIRKILRNQLDKWDSNLPYDWIIQAPTSLFVKTFSCAHQLLEKLKIGTVGTINLEILQRGIANKIRRYLPNQLLLVIDRNTEHNCNTSEILVCYENKWHNCNSINSRTLNFIIKSSLNKTVMFNPSERFGIDPEYFNNIQDTWHNLWLIKNPTLRAIRHKILYKDIWTMEKRYRLGIANDNKCTICGEIETVFHQLFKCRNAVKLWQVFKDLVKIDLPATELDYAKLISVSNDYIAETIKACIFKLLIQIDRSVEITNNQIKRYISYWLTVEYKSLIKTYKGNNSQSRRLTCVLDCLNRESC